MGSRPHKTTTTRRREKREERRAKSEERRERREERREKKEERRDPKRGRQRSPNEAARGGPTLFSAIPPPDGTSGGFEGRGKRAEKREKREERRKKMAASSIHCISTVSRDHLKEVMKIRSGHRKCRKLDSLHFYGVP